MSTPRYALTLDELSRLLGEAPETTRESLAALGVEHVGKTGLVPPPKVRELLEQRGHDYAARVIANVNLRGGIGKTTCTITTASRAAQLGCKTCILDLDAQGSASSAFDRIPDVDEPIFYDVWQKPDEMVMGSLKKIDEFLYILPSALENGLLDVSLINPAAQKKAVRGVCRELLEEGFDLVAIDCPPSLGAAVISTICAADVIVIPVWSDPFSFKGIELTMQEITSICETFHLDAPAVKLLYARHDKRVKLAAQALERLGTEYSDHFAPFVIPTSTEFSKALARKETIFASRRSSPAKTAYDALTRHLMEFDILGQGDADADA